ncbi:hypothetical protein [Ectothiorhodospira mobilis]|uniref:hypothetical protein n=1 Tax=Ectothiorhodospira mobilis TaxID=195064 RepID=UPI001EE80D42|nr:hypothetical protein [Ectothiorhodospira mobilis]MCG5534860.1 hypothetical protein [Ectothiorhodospira mobilis]
MDSHTRPLEERIRWLYALAEHHARTFSGAEATLDRTRYLARHPTRVVVMKCMDGRIHIPHATGTPLGVIHPFRNLGGRFDLGWPFLGEMLTRTVQQAAACGHRVLMMITYHFSRGDRTRGCAGFDCDTHAARAHAFQIQDQARRLFGPGGGGVYPLVCGFETDQEALILHGETGATLDLAALSPQQRGELDPHMATLCPQMPTAVRRDLLPLLQGNLDHIASLRGSTRDLDLQHREWAICVGQGFDFLHTPNTALIIGPYSPDLAEPIRNAAAIIRDNMAAGRIPDDGCLLLASAPYEEMGVDRARAELKARFLGGFAAEVIQREDPDLARRMVRHTAVVDWRTRGLERLPA